MAGWQAGLLVLVQSVLQHMHVVLPANTAANNLQTGYQLVQITAPGRQNFCRITDPGAGKVAYANLSTCKTRHCFLDKPWSTCPDKVSRHLAHDWQLAALQSSEVYAREYW